MDWSNERYVRVYVRDTTTWRRLGWHGQNVLMQLLRKADRAGTLELDGLEPWEAVVLHCHAPEADAQAGAALCVSLGVFEVRQGMIVFPNFIDAQEAIKSDKLRARESRERKSRGELQTETQQSASRFVMEPSRAVTSGHAESRAVTPRHSVLCSAVQCSTVPKEERDESLALPVVPLASEPANTADRRADDAGPPPGTAERRVTAAEQLVELSARYDAKLAADARAACAMSRRGGHMQDSVWANVLRTCASHPVASVESAMRIFVERYSDGEKDERYLLGIVRGEVRARRAAPGARLPPTSAASADAWEHIEDELAERSSK